MEAPGIYLSIPIVSYYILKWLLWLFSPHIETHPFIHITANHLRTVSCTLLESRLCDLQRFHSSLWVSWLCSSAEVGSRHPETMLMAVETLTGLIFSQFGGYICTLLHIICVYSSSNPQKIEKPVLTILLGFHLFFSRGFIHTHNIIDIHLCHSLHIIIVFTSISYLHRCMYTHLIYIYNAYI